METNYEPVLEQKEKLKQRHGCVTTLLILMIIANSIGALLYFFFNDFIIQNLPNTSPTLLFLLGITGTLNVVCTILLFKWKKWGFWGYIISSVCILIINTCIGIGFFQSLFGLIGFIIMFWVLKFKKNNVSAWDNME